MADRNTVIRGNQIKDATITADELNASVAGSGIAGGAGSALSVNVDDSSIEVSTDTVQVKDAGITAAKLAAAIAGDGLAGGAGSALSVNVDDSSIELNSDSLRVKADGIGANEVDLSGTYDFDGSSGTVKVSNPTAAKEAANKEYVDAVVAGVEIHEACELASVVEYTATYDNGASGVGATLTNNDTQAALEVDGVTPEVADRIMIKDQVSNDFQNGIYVVTVVGTGATNWVLTRSEDFDNAPGEEIHAGDFFFVTLGDTQAQNGYVQVEDWSGSEAVGTDSINFEQFSGAGQIEAGDGLSKDGNTLSVNVDDSTTEISGDAVIVKDAGIATAKLADDSVDKDKINADIAGAALGQAAGGELDVNVDDSTIEVNTDALRLKALGVTNAHISETANIADGKLAEDYVKTSEVDDSSIEFSGATLNVKALGIATGMIAADAVDKTKVAADIAGLGLSQAVGGELDVNVDDSSIEINVDTLRVKAGGISAAMLAESYVEQTDVDDSSIEFSGGTLNVKAVGITNAMLAGSIANAKLVDIADSKLVEDYVKTSEVDDSTIEFGASLNVKDLGITNAKIANDTILEAKLDATNAPTDGYVLSFDNGTGGFTWIAGAADSVKESDFVKGTVNASGSETELSSFSGDAPVLASSVQVYLNGLIQEEGAGNDYTIVLATGVVTFLTALEAGDIVIMNGVLNN
ncbi:MAG: hypothetical protein ACTSYR_03400 [Candidatus Odinarchaeia archaeon]